MNTRAAAVFAAVVFIALGLWISVEGWQKKWKAKGIAQRAGGAAALVVGAFCGLKALRS